VVLRELNLSAVRDHETLLLAILDHPSMRELKRYERLPALLANGQVVFLLDGLDEVPHDLRAPLGATIRRAMQEYEMCRWLITSRVVGFEAFELDARSVARAPGLREERNLLDGRDEHRLIERRYIAPLGDDQIDGFAHRWFQLREESTDRAASQAREFSEAVRSDIQTRQLARVASFLTLMALVFRSQARLPHGRALLYEKIADAYLETIEGAKHLSWTALSLAEKKRCLAYVAFQMQRGRLDTAEGSHREILVSGNRLLELLARSINEAQAAEFLDYLRDRSGLIQQLGPDQFAFAHLSFQDYFAALHLADRITSPRWILGVDAGDGTSKNDMRRYFRESDWRETILLLFEVLAGRSDWCDALLKELFDPAVELADIDAAGVVAALTVNPHSGLSRDLRWAAMEHCWTREIAEQQKASFFSRHASPVLSAFGGKNNSDDVWDSLRISLKKIAPRNLSLEGCNGFTDLAQLDLPDSVRNLELGRTGISDVSCLLRAIQLRSLDMKETAVADLRPLRNTPLHGLFIEKTRVHDLSMLKRDTIVNLDVSWTSVNPLELRDFTNLQLLFAKGLAIEDLFLLSDATGIDILNLEDTPLRTLAGIDRYPRLKWLNISRTRVDDIGPLATLKYLEVVFLDGTSVTDVAPLIALDKLVTVSIPRHVEERDRVHLLTRFPNAKII
jgi:internalin A